MSHPREAAGQDMKEEAAEELQSIEGHQLRTVAVGAVAPTEGHLSVAVTDETMIRDGDPVGVASQVTQDRLRASKRRLAVDDPFFARRIAEKVASVALRNSEIALLQFALEATEKLGSEHPAEDAHRE